MTSTTMLKPFDFQIEAINKLSKQKSRLLGDDMGLGKTLQGVEIDKLNRKARLEGQPGAKMKTLIVTPKGVIDDGAWQRAIATQCGNVPVYVINPKKRDEFEKAASDGRKPGYFICHWESLRLMKGLNKVDWFHIIADEVHRAKSRTAQQTQALKALRTEYKTALSGTWADDKPQDAWSVLNWLWPSHYSSYWNFVRHYCVSEKQEDPSGKTNGYMKVIGVNEANIPFLRKEMEPWYTRRLKEDVLKDLPEKYFTTVWVDLLPGQRKAYEQMRKDMIAWINENEGTPLVASVAIAQLTRLQQFAIGSAEIIGYKMKAFKDAEGNVELREVPDVKMVDPSSKLDKLMEILEDADLEKTPVVVFSQFKQSVKLLERRCLEKGIKIATLTGDTKQKDRAEMIAGFQAGRFQVFAGTIAAGGVGITLTRASTIVFLDRAWSPSMNKQAEDRLHRIGQKNAVQVIDIMARNTVDHGRVQKIASKWEELKKILGDV